MYDYEKPLNYLDKYRHVESDLIEGSLSAQVPVLSIVIPTYKRTEALRKTVESALSQSVSEEYDVIVVDNDDSDSPEVRDIMHSLACGKLLYYKNRKNLGMYGNWNRCLELARSPWVAMLHDDDLLDSNYIETIFKIINNPKCSMDAFSVTAPFVPDLDTLHRNKLARPSILRRFRNKTGLLFEKIKPQDYIMGLPHYWTGFVFRRDFFVAMGGFNDAMYPNEDACFSYKMSCNGNVYLYLEALGITVTDDSESTKPETRVSLYLTNLPFRDAVVGKYRGLRRLFYSFLRNAANRRDFRNLEEPLREQVLEKHEKPLSPNYTRVHALALRLFRAYRKIVSVRKVI